MLVVWWYCREYSPTHMRVRRYGSCYMVRGLLYAVGSSALVLLVYCSVFNSLRLT